MMKRLLLSLVALIAFSGISEAQTIVSSDRTVAGTTVTYVSPVPKMRIAFSGGLARQIGKIDKSVDANLQEYQKSLLTGPQYGVGITYYISDSFGVGMVYNDAHFASSVTGTMVFEDGTSKSGTLSDNIHIRFIGPEVSTRWISMDVKHMVATNYGLGYLGYVDNFQIPGSQYTQSGGTLGWKLGFDYDYIFAKWFVAGVSLSYYSGSINAYTQTDSEGVSEKIRLDSDSQQSLRHLTLSIGIRFLL